MLAIGFCLLSRQGEVVGFNCLGINNANNIPYNGDVASFIQMLLTQIYNDLNIDMLRGPNKSVQQYQF